MLQTGNIYFEKHWVFAFQKHIQCLERKIKEILREIPINLISQVKLSKYLVQFWDWVKCGNPSDNKLIYIMLLFPYKYQMEFPWKLLKQTSYISFS
jgi:hypothetical protein